MSLRSIRVYSLTQSDDTYSVLLESANNEKFLLIQSGGMISVDKELGNNMKSIYQKISDGFAMLGILRLSDGININYFKFRFFWKIQII